jgi:CHAD domain-containing protein
MADELERARKTLRELARSLRSLPRNPLPVEVHRLRTAARRVEAIAAALEQTSEKASRRLLKSIEPIRKAAGSVRDMDVLARNARRLARHATGDSLTRLVGHLEAARQQNAEALRRVLNRRGDPARKKLNRYSKLVRSALKPPKGSVTASRHVAHSHDGVHTAALEVLRELGEWPPLHLDNIHEFRLKVKELRYLLQLLAEADPALVDALADVQRRIGDWHDWHQLGEIAHKVLHQEQDRPLLARIDQTARRRFDQALKAANTLRGRYLTAPLLPGI